MSIKNHYHSKFNELKDPIKDWKHKTNTKDTGISYQHYLNELNDTKDLQNIWKGIKTSFHRKVQIKHNLMPSLIIMLL